jgi:hypothetical protein
MRTTIDLDEDIAAAVERLRRERSMGLSEAVNTLARAGLTIRTDRPPFVQRTAPLGLRVDVRDIGEVLDRLDALDRT